MFKLTDEQKEMLLMSEEDIKNGRLIFQEEMDKRNHEPYHNRLVRHSFRRCLKQLDDSLICSVMLKPCVNVANGVHVIYKRIVW